MTIAPPKDRAWLARAIALASQVAGATSPNPNVGCVIAVEGDVVGEGATAPVGGPHAEVVALERAGRRARGATAYVTLEPCDHHGRTPPCTQALIRSGIRRVVIAHPEPHGVAAGGAERLRAAGIEVVGPAGPDDVLRLAVAAQLEGFLAVVAGGRPHVTLKLAQTADGHLHAPCPDRWITGPAARRAVHRLRAVADAVLVGSGTVIDDDPRLDVRDVPANVDPRPVVFDGRLRTPTTAAVVRRGALIVTRPDAPPEHRSALIEAGAEVIDVASAAGHGVDLHAGMAALADRDISTVLVEAGATLSGALLRAGLVDRLVLHVALGVGSGPARRVLPSSDDPCPWVTERSGGAGTDLIWHLVPSRSHRAQGRVATTEGT